MNNLPAGGTIRDEDDRELMYSREGYAMRGLIALVTVAFLVGIGILVVWLAVETVKTNTAQVQATWEGK